MARLTDSNGKFTQQTKVSEASYFLIASCSVSLNGCLKSNIV